MPVTHCIVCGDQSTSTYCSMACADEDLLRIQPLAEAQPSDDTAYEVENDPDYGGSTFDRGRGTW